MYKQKVFAWLDRTIICLSLGVFFMMMPLAVFASADVPTVQITTPTPGQNTTNGFFTVSGKAGDNVAVATVYYSLNGAPWTNASTANNWTNWTASLTLNPGTNSFKAFAVDTSGNASTTNAVSFEYVVPMPLSLQVFGLGVPNPKWGSLSAGYTTTSVWLTGYGYYSTTVKLPGYTNGTLLAVNENYTLTAVPAPGFAFSNWSDGSGNLFTNGPTLRFTMATNFALAANFVDITKPTLSITTPTLNQQGGKRVIAATGKAGDNVAVATVFYSLNGSPWTNATTANNWTNWWAILPLVPGTNTLQAFALDSSGNASTTNAVSFEYVVAMPLSLQVFGLGVPNPKWGSLSAGYTNGTLLDVNENYVITAVPATGFAFSNWSDGSGNLFTNGPTLRFTMATNLARAANFVDITKPTLSIVSPTPNQSSLWIGTGDQNQPDESIVNIALGIMNATAPQELEGIAGSAQNIPREYWISTNATGNYFTNATHYSGGTLDNPLDGSTQQTFDFNMSNMPPNSVVHLLPGTYQTLGNIPGGWGVKDNQRILGSGMNITVLQHPAWEVTNHSLIDRCSVVGCGANAGPPTNVDLEDFTVDGNYYRSNYSAGDYASFEGITLFGSYNTVNHVRVINLAAYAPTNGYKESWGIVIDPYHGSDHNLIENCEVSHFTATNYCDLGAIFIMGSGVITNNTVIQEEPCDTIYAIAELSGSISGNTTIGCSTFSYIDDGTLNVNNLLISNNSILYSPFGIAWRNVSESNVKILNNFFVMGYGASPWAPKNFTSCVVLTPHNSVGVANFYDVQFSGNMVENVSSNALELSLFNATGGVGLDISGNAIESCFSNILTDCAGVAINGNYDLYGNNLAVTGKAADNAAVAAVYYSLNGSLWTNASTANNWTNWTGSLALTPGTNTIQAYAVDTSGNLSLTNTVKYVYGVPRPLKVSINGQGTVTPNDNGVLLLVNENYTLTANAAAGFAFTNWTDGSGNLLTNNATLQFTMATNLAVTANFVDVQKPTLSIVTPTLNLQWSNGTFTATGKAADNVAVATVFYSLNGSPWTNAIPVNNNLTNWSASLTLTPGTNSLKAFAVDTSGNASPTNSVSFEYVVPMPLSVQVFGLGVPNLKWGSLNSGYTTTLAWIPGYGYYPTTVRLPSYTNGSLLAVNENYVVTAVPAPGFAFTNWSDGNGILLTNGPTLCFTMATNLSLVANFVDITKPTLSITAPTPNQQWSNAIFTATGKAGDNVAAASVFFSLNGSPWTNATTANNWTTWSATLPLTPGANTLQAFALDTSGNLSLTNTVEFVYVMPKPMAVKPIAAYPAASATLVPASLVPASIVNGQFALTVLGATNYRCIVQASANLVDWVSVQTNTAPFTYVDTNAGKFKQCFYRTVYIQ
jgi:hypothetical protein